MTATRYPIPGATTRVQTQVVNSRFVATMGEARSVEIARAFIASVRAELADATHHAFAFQVGYGSSIIDGLSDGGEPPGTAGRPALAVLQGAGLGDVVLVISRYFGGTKLGTGALVRAYTQAAQAALAALPLSERVEYRNGQIRVPYALYERVKRLMVECAGLIGHESFAAEVTLEVRFPADGMSRFEAALQELSAGQILIDWHDT